MNFNRDGKPLPQSKFSTPSRRKFLKNSAMFITGAALSSSFLAACGDSTATPASAGSTTNAASATTAAGTNGATTATGTSAAAGATNAATNGVAATTNVLTLHGGSASATWLRNFNPFTGTPRYPTLNGVYEPLMIYNTVKTEIVPWLATKYSWSSDNKTLTFTLRDGVKWSDGQPFTANDVVYTFQLFQKTAGLQGPGLLAMNKNTGYVSSVAASDDKTVAFTFSRVFSPGLYDIMSQMIVPEHVWKTVADPVKFTNDNPVGTGPFTQVTVFQNQIYQVDKNPNYWQSDQIKINGLRYPAFSDPQAIQLALVDGQIEWAHAFVPTIDQTFIPKDPSHRGYYFPGIAQMVLLDLNTTKKPFDDVNVRKAISMGLNRQQVVTVAEQGYIHPADVTGLTDAFPQFKVTDASKLGNWTNFDANQANQMLDSAGYKKGADGIRTAPDGTKLSFKLTTVSVFADWNSATQIIMQNLKAIGFNITIQGYDFANYLDHVQKGDFDMAVAFSALGATPFDFYRGVMSKSTSAEIGQAASQNYARYVSAKGEDLLNQFSATTDAVQQKQIAQQLQQVFADEAPALPLWPQPAWYEYNDVHFTGFPTKDNLYVHGNHAGQTAPGQLIVYTHLRPR
jgi:peptide/nickel transport system substrate-binding protein